MIRNLSMIEAEKNKQDYSFVGSTARIALYDDFLSSPRIIEIPPAPTRDFIGNLASKTYEQAKTAGGQIPYTIIEQVTENFIHANFTEMVVSIFDDGNTIRFTDQGPGIIDKDKAQQPGYSSATQAMKNFINGVGSGLPIVREYLDTKNGTIQIEDNMNTGAVVTISLVEKEIPKQDYSSTDQTEYHQELNISAYNPVLNTEKDYLNTVKSEALNSVQSNQISMNILLSSLSKRAINILMLFNNESIWGVKSISEITGIPIASTHNELSKLEQLGLIMHIGKKRALTDLGNQVLKNL